MTAALMITSRKVTTMMTVVSTSTNAGQWLTSPSEDAPANCLISFAGHQSTR
jgi:hypothetical protein